MTWGDLWPSGDDALSAVISWELEVNVSIGRPVPAELVGNDVRVGCAPSYCTATPLHRRLVTAAQAVAHTRVTGDEAVRPYDVAIIWAR